MDDRADILDPVLNWSGYTSTSKLYGARAQT